MSEKIPPFQVGLKAGDKGVGEIGYKEIGYKGIGYREWGICKRTRGELFF